MTPQTVLPRAALVLALAAALPLGGCKKDKKEPAKAAAAAGGEILPRSVTDDMLPYDTVKSQAPLANPDAGKNKGKTSPAATPSESAGADEEEAAAAAPPAAETAPEPAAPDAG
ncbi:hypothetical protein [Novosphingobium beihaiensis]|uniref:Lipoprotein n=1 Tax=Novosphingobium beihaiensis TaxID=2930389 RepID=A0ABT0BSJ9_9SPHN|nr:hypothetical protein [Novosphingobium beihaiensis]MCJ2188019.1 hypothetical protein [Novosphingobium beihaiensis]